MRTLHVPRSSLALVVPVLAVLASCATVDTGVAWNILPAGSTWQVEQRNTGSYGKDVTYQVVRGEAVWQGQPAVTFTNATSGMTIMATADGKWSAIVNREGKPMVTYDPPIGYVYPLKAGASWSTQHTMTAANGTKTPITYSCVVEGREKVTVPAGTFDTMKVVCESPVSRDVSWTIVDLGMHAKQEFQRLASHPQGAGTQQMQLLAVKRSG